MGWTCAHQHHRDGAPSEGWTPSGCCSPEGYGHPRAASSLWCWCAQVQPMEEVH